MISCPLLLGSSKMENPGREGSALCSRRPGSRGRGQSVSIRDKPSMIDF